MLQQIRRELLAAVPLTVLLGGALGLGLTRLLQVPLRQSPTFSLETLVQVGVGIFAPVGVTLVWITCAVPPRVGAAAMAGSGGRMASIRPLLSAAFCVVLLLPWFIAAMLLAGVLVSERPDPPAQIPMLLALLPLSSLPAAALRAAPAAALCAALCRWRGRRLVPDRPEDLVRGIVQALGASVLVVLGLEAIALAVFKPTLAVAG
jgi:hypothetical protein